MAADKSTLYFISCGPGDPDLITVAGLKALQKCRSVLAPAVFIKTFAQYLADKEVQSPFTMDRAALTAWIEERLAKGDVAFMAPGDFSTFCPFQSFAGQFRDRAVVIPGVGAHPAAAAILKRSFDTPGVAHATIVTSPKAFRREGGGGVGEFAGPGRTLVLYMNDLPLPDLVAELLKGYPPQTPIGIFENIGDPGQVVTIATLATIVAALGDRDPYGINSGSPEPALALTVVGEAVGVDEDMKWWDYRYERIWKPRGMK